MSHGLDGDVTWGQRLKVRSIAGSYREGAESLRHWMCALEDYNGSHGSLFSLSTMRQMVSHHGMLPPYKPKGTAANHRQEPPSLLSLYLSNLSCSLQEVNHHTRRANPGEKKAQCIHILYLNVHYECS